MKPHHLEGFYRLSQKTTDKDKLFLFFPNFESSNKSKTKVSLIIGEGKETYSFKYLLRLNIFVNND